MAFFKPTANLPSGEKARIEFHFQQIAECIGVGRLRLPVLSQMNVLYENSSQPPEPRSVDQIKSLVGEHLGHDVSDVRIQSLPMQTQKVGGGG